MRNFLLLLPALFALQTKAQTSVYFPFPDSNAVWRIVAQGCCVSNCPPPPLVNPVLVDNNFTYCLQGDTIINAITYHKVYVPAVNVYEHCAYGNFLNNQYTLGSSYTGGLRQDTVLKQVYFIYQGWGQECLLYDFSLQVNDTLTNGCQNWQQYTIVSSIDSVLIGNSYRKRISYTGSPYFVMEGIGSTAGLLEPMFPFEYFGTLVCFSQNGQTLYPDTITQCSIISHVNQAHESLNLPAYPNPFHTSTTIYPGKDFLNGDLTIYNVLGERVGKQIVNDTAVSIRRDGLDNGIYFFRIISHSGQLVSGKLIIQ